jgi:hypothetical protein
MKPPRKKTGSGRSKMKGWEGRAAGYQPALLPDEVRALNDAPPVETESSLAEPLPGLGDALDAAPALKSSKASSSRGELKKQLRHLSIALNSERSKSLALANAADYATARLNDLEAERIHPARAPSEARTEAGATVSRTEALERELSRERERVAEVTGQIDATNAVLGEVLQASGDLETKLNEMRAWRAGNQAREARLERALDQAERSGRAAAEQIAEAQALLSRERQRAAELSDAVAAMANRLLTEQEHISALNIRAAAADSSSTRERLQVESLQTVLAAMESKLADELTRATRAESELRVAGRHAAGAQITATEEQERLSMALVELERREREISALLNSTSWRLTAPWRVFRQQWSRLRRVLRGNMINPLFDRRWYVKQYRDVKESEFDPYDHYLLHGAAEGRNPNPLFDTAWYLQQNSTSQPGNNAQT